MLIVAWSPGGSLAAFFDEDVFRNVLTIFITQAFLNLLQGIGDIWLKIRVSFSINYLLLPACNHPWKETWLCDTIAFSNFEASLCYNATVTSLQTYPVSTACCRLNNYGQYSYFSTLFSVVALDIVLSFNAWKSLKFTQIVRYLLKFVVAAAWAVILPICFATSVQNPTGLVKFFSNWIGNWQSQPLYSYAIAIYLLPNILAAVLFFLPRLRRIMERSNSHIITLIMWWAQVRISRMVTFRWSFFFFFGTILFLPF